MVSGHLPPEGTPGAVNPRETREVPHHRRSLGILEATPIGDRPGQSASLSGAVLPGAKIAYNLIDRPELPS
ncbi:hypothetical protein [Phormidium sp. CCY1219]|uniref:hypothetical protein n=1 Tax=Phormidium sp. CCY1219 TaxID=2886104 RepID=UPI002D1EB95A|nr:hypothetical protein [Phormidium sp. CCY1219]MEB3831831.1 hypothetical protein [Phormidium sp. CCY1219]